MGVRRWWSEWSAMRSPWARARIANERLARAIDALPIATAERIVASWLDQPPIDTSDPDLYNAAFVRLRAGWVVVGTTIANGPPPYLEPAEIATLEAVGRVVVWFHDDEPGLVRPGAYEVRFADDEAPIHPSIAHAVIAHAVLPDATEVLEALATDPTAPVPRCRYRMPPGPDARRSWHDPPKIDDRSRAWALVGGVVAVPVGVLFAALALLALSGQRPEVCGGLFMLAFGIAITVSQGARLFEVLVWEPQARRITPLTERGFTHPGNGEAVPWSAVLRAERKWRRIVLVLSETDRFVVPWSLFVEPQHAEHWLLDRVGRERAPYRGR